MTWTLRAHVAMTETEDGAVLLDEHLGKYFQLNRSATLVLRHLLDGGTATSAASCLSQWHPDAAARAQGDVTRIVDTLVKAGLVHA
ncbi:hypothetical protein GCM10010174_27580 [Kutzneria viridogrisea]|uniref:DNA-binding MarR family transcriptional regulator n=1 Tax=Kutzneria viridogrisea TaxID=47990 RepID=A0ABR6BV97_9PSEU|nr:DNA-binding MarR family transcriptional regulator [Kutzneria viridogrisea]